MGCDLATKQLLLHHIVRERIMVSDLVEMPCVSSAQGRPLKVWLEEEQVMVGGAHVLIADIVATNGVIHMVDRVLLPPESDR